MKLNSQTTPALRGDRNQCPTCAERFNSTHAFDKHRVTNLHGRGRVCLSPDGMLDIGMAKNSAGWWVGSLRAEGYTPPSD